MKTKKSQIIGQVFVFILATVVFVLIIMYGYRAISSLMVRGEQAQLVQFQNELTTAVSAMSLDYRSVKCKELTLPKKYTAFCFVDARNPPPEAASLPSMSEWKNFYDEYPFIYDSIHSKVAQNVFLIPPSEISINLENAHTQENTLDPYSGFFCINVTRNKILLKLEGRGVEGVELSRWQDTKC
jgi:hypothetical protein